MILDTSAIVAIILGQAESAALMRAGLADPRGFLVELDVHAIPFGDEHWRQAGMAFSRYGKGRHPASLNFGDCLTYAVAKLSGLPLLCLGGDFPQTDLTLAPLTA